MVVIAISGLPGSGSTTVSKLLAKQLKISFFSAGDKEKAVASTYFKSPETEASEKYLKISSEKFHIKLDQLQREIAKQGDVVIDGKLAIKNLNDIADFKVWITCHFAARTKRVAQRDNIEIENARKILEKKEQLEEETWKKFYNFDYKDQSKMADIIVDTTEISPEEAVGQIIRRMKK